MDLQAAMGQFLDAEGNVTLQPEFTLPGLCEALFQFTTAAGGGDAVALRFWDYREDREGRERTLSRKEINTKVKAVAARLQQTGQPGDHVAILANNSPEYIVAFLGAMYAGMTPVPLYDPTEPGHSGHLTAVIGSATPAIVLTNTDAAAAVRSFFSNVPGTKRPRILAIDALPDTVASSWSQQTFEQALAARIERHGGTPVELPAMLQFTSGSTRTPAGVMLTHRSIITNVLQIFAAAKLKSPVRLVSWLPLHHDMGIIIAAFSVITGLELEMMAPRDFVQQPGRWLRQLHKRGDAYVYTVVPNFALEMASRAGVASAKLDEAEEPLDLSHVDAVVVGSEPVTKHALDAFLGEFEASGLPRESLRPSYGLAEASLLVSTPQTTHRPLVTHFDREALAEGRLEVVDADADTKHAVALTSCGQAVAPQRLVVVDPDTRSELPDATIGELWAHGDNMAAGYLNREEETAATFHNTLAKRREPSRAAGVPEDSDRWMATGDLGGIVEGELYITGRLKDLIIIAGRNHYPQDVERTAELATEHVRPNAVAAFAVPGDSVEELVILAERDFGRNEEEDAQAVEAIREAVSRSHGVTPHEVRILAPDTIDRSSSGKIARRVAQRRYTAETPAS